MKHMISKLFATSLLMVSLSAPSAESPTPYSAQRLQSLQAKGKTVLVDVHANWCPTCRAQAPILEKLLKEPSLSKIAELRLDWDAQRDEARAMGAPRQSTLLLYRGGKKIALSVAETREGPLREFLSQGVK
ncbi:thioredoxin domain-containing protein [Lysobacter sp. CA196]|uniref:thioredoxin domain-containing protein n=1 Tax=Lysobacter sp. CA196 TaxID=3455606 RepID=UPI003F8D0CD1